MYTAKPLTDSAGNTLTPKASNRSVLRTELDTAPTTRWGSVLSAAPRASMNLSTVDPVPTPTTLPAVT